MASRCALAVLLAALLVVCGRAQVPLEVLKLTPSSFEHETQAATGQTTGHWCVLFTNSSSPSSLQVAAEDAWDNLARDENRDATIMAQVDVAASGGPGLAKRFNLTGATPAALLFRDRAMYPLPPLAGDGSGEAAPDVEAIAALAHAFMDGGYEHQVPHPVPGEATLLDLAIEAASMLKVSPTPMLWAGIACMSVGLLFFLGMVTVGVWYMYAPDKPKPPRTAAAAAVGAAASSSKQPAAAAALKQAAASDDADSEGGDEDGDDAAEVVKASGAAKPATRARRRA